MAAKPQTGSGSGQDQSSTTPPPEILTQIIEEFERGRRDDQKKQTLTGLTRFLQRRKDLLEKIEKLPEGEFPMKLEQEIISEIGLLDHDISVQLDQVMHHEEFKKLEATWRGVQRLVFQTELADDLKINLIDVTKDELKKDLLGSDYLDSFLFKIIHERGYDQPGAGIYGVLLGDFDFTQDYEDTALLTKISQVAAVSHAPFIGCAGPQILGLPAADPTGKSLERFDQLEGAGPLFDIIKGPEYAHWEQFRKHPNSRYVGLVLPRILLRYPYRQDPSKHDSAQADFIYEEEVAGPDNSNFLWGRAVWAYGECLTGAFNNYGWCTAIRGEEGGGLVELPYYPFPDQDGRYAGPTDTLIPDSRENELSRQGFIALVHTKDTPEAVFVSGQSCQIPQQYYEGEATGSAELSARLPNIFAVSRFAHFLKIILRKKVGSFMDRADCENFLNKWISNYVLLKENATQEDKARYPLSEAKVVVKDVIGHPGTYEAIAWVKPHYQLEEISISLRLVTNLPDDVKAN